MRAEQDQRLAREIADIAVPLTGARRDFDALLDSIGDARVVLIGEASHGTHEFYRLRAALTKRLIVEKGFAAVTAEADWPDAARVDAYVRGRGRDRDAVDALGDFRRFPAWMWRNADVLDFVGWLRSHNEAHAPHRRVGFYGLDLYSLHDSVSAVLRYLDRVDAAAARRARQRYACFEQFGRDPQTYGANTAFGLTADCEAEVIAQLVELQRRRGGARASADDELFLAEQNARVVRNAEAYYRAMFRDHVGSWNLRDTHMADTLDAVLDHLDARSGRSKAVVWAHNSHVGDARATELGDAGEIDIGQLARERHPGRVALVGFSTAGGTVTAASSWGGAAEHKRVRPALPGSYEALFASVELPGFVLSLRDVACADALREPRLQRAIGVIYRPETERASHYFRARLADQFDAVIHIDRTRAVEPLERTAAWELREPAETYPTGM
jgi:erythromycin esterase-like protein